MVSLCALGLYEHIYHKAVQKKYPFQKKKKVFTRSSRVQNCSRMVYILCWLDTVKCLCCGMNLYLASSMASWSCRDSSSSSSSSTSLNVRRLFLRGLGAGSLGRQFGQNQSPDGTFCGTHTNHRDKAYRKTRHHKQQCDGDKKNWRWLLSTHTHNAHAHIQCPHVYMWGHTHPNSTVMWGTHTHTLVHSVPLYICGGVRSHANTHMRSCTPCPQVYMWGHTHTHNVPMYTCGGTHAHTHTCARAHAHHVPMYTCGGTHTRANTMSPCIHVGAHTRTQHTHAQDTHTLHWPSWEASGSTCDDHGHTYHTAAFSRHHPCGDRYGSEPAGQSGPTWCSCPAQPGEGRPGTGWSCPAPTLPSARRSPAADAPCLACLGTRQMAQSVEWYHHTKAERSCGDRHWRKPNHEHFCSQKKKKLGISFKYTLKT